MEKIFTNSTSDRKLITKLQKGLQKFKHQDPHGRA